MSLEFDATYRDGAILPDAPLGLPNNTPLRVLVMPKRPATASEPWPMSREEILALRPQAPQFTPDQLDRLLAEFSLSASSLPADFSRADIYSDHD